MGFSNIPAGKNPPEEINVIIEIPMRGEPIKYEIDKETDAIFVDRFMATSMHYPCNYGYVPQTLSDDGDPLDVLVMALIPLMPGVVIRCRPIGILNMEDESGFDEKVLAVPISKITPIYDNVNTYSDLAPLTYKRIEHFFENYKSLEPGKWVKMKGWRHADSAKDVIVKSIENYKNSAK